MEFTIKIGKKSYTVKKANNDFKPIHFALDFVDGKPFLGYWLDVEIELEDNNIKFERIPVIISKDEILVYHNEYLMEKGYRTKVLPIEQENWWSGKVFDVNPVEYFNQVLNVFRSYIDLEEEKLIILTLWTIGTIFHTLFEAYPYLYIHGTKRSGKTKCLNLIRLLCFNGLISHSTTEATLYRLVESSRTTLLIDEQDYLAKPERKTELRTLLLGGYKQGSCVLRTEKETELKIKPKTFQIYSPKALANIEGLDDVLADRTIRILFKRSKEVNITRKRILDTDFNWLYLRDCLANFYLSYAKEIYETSKLVAKLLNGEEVEIDGEIRELFNFAKTFIYSRNEELWTPILTLALFFHLKGINILREVINFAYEEIREKELEEVETPEASLLEALYELVVEDDYYPLKDILTKMKEKTEIKSLNEKVIGRMLKRLGFKDKKKKSGRIYYFISRNMLDDLKERLKIEIETEDITKTDIPLNLKETPLTPSNLLREKDYLTDLLRNVDSILRSRGLTENELTCYLLGKNVQYEYVKRIIDSLKEQGIIILGLDGKYYRKM